jgi:hypothetical protein
MRLPGGQRGRRRAAGRGGRLTVDTGILRLEAGRDLIPRTE